MDTRGNLEIVYTYILHGLAGFLNALTIMIFGQMTGVMTGNMSKIVISTMSGEHSTAKILLIYTLCYFIGSVISGFLTQFHVSHNLRDLEFFGYHLLFAAMFAIAWFVNGTDVLGISVVAVRLGIQNALPLPSRRKRIRTTSMTGLLTEIGILVGGLLRQAKLVNMRNLTFNILYLLTFIFGTGVAAFVHYQTDLNVLVFAIFLEILTALFCYYLSTIKEED